VPENQPDDRPLFAAAPPSADPRVFPPVPARARVGRDQVPVAPLSITRRVEPATSAPAGGPPPGAAPPPDAGPPPGPAATVAASRTREKRARRSSGTVVVGVVDGRVTVEHVRPVLWGARLLGGVVAASLVAAVLLTVVSGRSGPLASLVLPLAGLAVALGTGWLGSRGRRTAGPADAGAGEAIRRFRVQSVTGEVVACVLRGELSGDEVRHGDMVRVTGRRARDGHVAVRHADVLSAPTGPAVSRVSGRPRPGMLLARWGDRVSYVVAGLVALWVMLVATGLAG
jgi:hypothetical protein